MKPACKCQRMMVRLLKSALLAVLGPCLTTSRFTDCAAATEPPESAGNTVQQTSDDPLSNALVTIGARDELKDLVDSINAANRVSSELTPYRLAELAATAHSIATHVVLLKTRAVLKNDVRTNLNNAEQVAKSAAEQYQRRLTAEQNSPDRARQIDIIATTEFKDAAAKILKSFQLAKASLESSDVANAEAYDNAMLSLRKLAGDGDDKARELLVELADAGKVRATGEMTDWRKPLPTRILPSTAVELAKKLTAASHNSNFDPDRTFADETFPKNDFVAVSDSGIGWYKSIAYNAKGFSSTPPTYVMSVSFLQLGDQLSRESGDKQSQRNKLGSTIEQSILNAVPAHSLLLEMHLVTASGLETNPDACPYQLASVILVFNVNSAEADRICDQIDKHQPLRVHWKFLPVLANQKERSGYSRCLALGQIVDYQLLHGWTPLAAITSADGSKLTATSDGLVTSEAVKKHPSISSRSQSSDDGDTKIAMKTCPNCGGLGRIGSTATGEIRKFMIGDQGPLRTCPVCGGTGLVPAN